MYLKNNFNLLKVYYIANLRKVGKNNYKFFLKSIMYNVKKLKKTAIRIFF